MVEWNTIGKSKEEEGLWVKDVKVFGKTLLVKWKCI